MDSTQARSNKIKKNPESGIALAMVLAAIAVLSILVTEFTYIAQVNQKMAFDGLDQLKAHYLAKSGLKISLLRLKAYQNVKSTLSALGGGGNNPIAAAGAQAAIPKQMLDKIWSFPFIYPVPTNIPGLSLGDKEQITKFQKESGLEGNFSALIESESSKYNLNMILAPFAPPAPSPSPSGSPVPPTPGTSPGNPSPSPTPSFDPQLARNSLAEYLGTLITNKAQADADFSSEYRDYRIDELVDSIAAWADPTYERRNQSFKETVPLKRAPFSSLSELHMVPGMDDRLYELFTPNLTVSLTPGINVNTMNQATLRALVPQMTDEEAQEFFKFRDSEEEDHLFKNPEEFFKYLLNSVAAFRHNESEVSQFKGSLSKRNIRIVVDESEFKITVRSQVNQSTRVIEAWVTLTSKQDGKKSPPSNPNQTSPTAIPNSTPGAPSSPPDPGLRITFMRIL